jgi:hypothetical protein
VEGNRFVDISSGCTGSNRSNPPNYSLFLPAVRDTRTAPGVVADKLDQLLATVADFRARGFITPPHASDEGDPRLAISYCAPPVEGAAPESMEDAIGRARDALGEAPARANCELRDFMALIDANPDSFHDTAGEETRATVGELKSRALSAVFLLCKLDPAGPGCVDELRP